MAQIKYTYGSGSGAQVATKASGETLATAGKLMKANLTGEAVLDLEVFSTTVNGTFNPSAGKDGFSQVIVDVDTQGDTHYQAKDNIVPTESSQTITPDGPTYNALSSVQINGITNTYVGSSVPRQSTAKEQKTITVKTGDLDNVVATVTVPAGYYENPVTVTQEIDVLPSPTTPAATAAYILAGYHAFDGEGVELEGTMPNAGSNDLSIPSSDADGNITIPAGYYDGEGEVQTAAGTVKSGLATVADPSFVTDHFEQTVSVAAPSVETAGWVSSSKGIKQANSGNTKSLAELSGTVSVASITVYPEIAGRPVTGGTVIDATAGWTTTVPTSGVYVGHYTGGGNLGPIPTPSLALNAGYTDGTNHDITISSGNITANEFALYTRIKTTTIGAPTATNTIGAPAAVTGTASTVSVPSGATIVRWVATAVPSYTQAAQGYVTDTSAHSGSSATANLDIPVFQLS